jgi:LPS sulfotransferase NodH
MEASSLWDSPVFVLGPQRTGSTLVGRILSSAAGSAFTVNGKLLYYLMLWLSESSSGSLAGRHFRAEEIVHSLRRKPILGVGEQFVSEAETVLTGIAKRIADHTTDTSPTQLIREAMHGVYRTLNDTPVFWGDKYNEYILDLDRIRLVYPAARFIAMNRNEKAAATSALKAFGGRPWCPSTAELCAEKHDAWYDHWQVAKAAIPNASYLEISYEDLLAKPKETVSGLADFLTVTCDLFSESIAWIGTDRRFDRWMTSSMR